MSRRHETRPRESVRDRLVRATYRVGWAGAGRLPAPVARALAGPVAAAVVHRNPSAVRRLRHNLAVATGEPVSDGLARRAVASYLRTFHEVLALPHIPPERIAASVHVSDEPRLRAEYARRGIVVALPHSGNYDLAGAWACGAGLPVTTVAERLGDAEYSAFVRFRESLGMEVLSHRDPDTIRRLMHAVNRGRVICLIADRDLNSAGLQVRWRDVPITMPAGPALVARRSGAALIPAVCRYVGSDMHITLGPTIGALPDRSGLVEMTQLVTDFFAEQIASQPEDWHMLQPFFPTAAGGSASRGPA
jgi:phosphatidylinositol dimannoside acyltransferase